MYALNIHRELDKVTTFMEEIQEQHEIECEITGAIRKSFVMRLDEEDLENELNELIQSDSHHEVFLVLHQTVSCDTYRICSHYRHPLSHSLENYHQFQTIWTMYSFHQKIALQH